jgi:NAD(P)-dependent dehydrogenase (short-subunit alcohol dehydrogenase family)
MNKKTGGNMNDQRVAIVTAAGSGIGEACARELAARDYKIVLISRTDSAAAIATELSGVGIQGSVTKDEDLKRIFELAMESYGRIDAVVNNTGHAPGSSSHTGRRFDPHAHSLLLDISDEDWQRSLDIYFLNVVRMARHVTPQMEKQENGGSIVNISAFAAAEPSYAYPASSTIRSALSGFTKLYADRYARAGIRMNNILPGYINNWEWSDDVLNSLPFERAGTLEEIAKTAAFLLSADASYITGQNILVDGGVNRSI